jgi:redox-sensitive bicupin YhaK (pirin superfamily)
MLTLKRYGEIGGGDLGWLKAKHHFAIGGHGNPIHTPIGHLYVLNDDQIAPGTGFPMHHHANVEIISYVREGVVTHEDSLGNKGKTRAGDVQVMSNSRAPIVQENSYRWPVATTCPTHCRFVPMPRSLAPC